ncbi:Arc-like DNA binding domain protein [compost metagenome]
MSRTDPQFNLRIPEALRDKVMVAAKENKRSATAEILARLEESFVGEGLDSNLPAGVRKDLLIKSIDGTEDSRPVTRGELWDVVGRAIEDALQVMTIGPAPDNAKPKPNTGPKARKRFPRED